MSGSQTAYFDAIHTLSPPALKTGIDDLLSRATRESTAKHTLDQLIRFSLGRDVEDVDMCSPEEWNLLRSKAEVALSSLKPKEDLKRKKRPGDSSPAEFPADSKRPKLETSSKGMLEEDPVFTLHSVSVSSPTRKKLNITVFRKDSIRFTHATSGVLEALVSLDSLTRAFLIPTPGKSKRHWTVIILSSSDQSQIIFGLDAVPSSMTTTVHPEPPHIHPKGTESKSILTQFLSHLPHVVVQQPSLDWFRSSTNSPYVDAYLRTRDGHLFFLEDGLLFGEKRPCVWLGMEQIETVRMLTATGRTFSLFVTCVANVSQEEEADRETEFSLIDGKDQDSVALWVKNNRHRFGAAKVSKTDIQTTASGENVLATDKNVSTRKLNEESEDSDDADFEGDSESDGGSPSSLSSEDEQEDEEANEETDEDADGVEDEEANEEEETDEENQGRRDAEVPSRRLVTRVASKSAPDAANMAEVDLTDDVGREQNDDEVDELED